MKYTCPCCGYKKLDEEPPGTYDICDICFWEDDGVQFNDPDYEGGANVPSLRQAQKNFIEFGDKEGSLFLIEVTKQFSGRRVRKNHPLEKGFFSVRITSKKGWFNGSFFDASGLFRFKWWRKCCIKKEVSYHW